LESNNKDKRKTIPIRSAAYICSKDPPAHTNLVPIRKHAREPPARVHQPRSQTPSTLPCRGRRARIPVPISRTAPSDSRPPPPTSDSPQRTS